MRDPRCIRIAPSQSSCGAWSRRSDLTQLREIAKRGLRREQRHREADARHYAQHEQMGDGQAARKSDDAETCARGAQGQYAERFADDQPPSQFPGRPRRRSRHAHRSAAAQPCARTPRTAAERPSAFSRISVRLLELELHASQLPPAVESVVARITPKLARDSARDVAEQLLQCWPDERLLGLLEIEAARNKDPKERLPWSRFFPSAELECLINALSLCAEKPAHPGPSNARELSIQRLAALHEERVDKVRTSCETTYRCSSASPS